MRRSTPSYFILIIIFRIASFFAKKLDLQPLSLEQFHRESEIKTVDAFIMIKAKFPEIFSQFYGFPAVSLGHHTVYVIACSAHGGFPMRFTCPVGLALDVKLTGA